MLSIPDMALLGAAALLLFGPEQLPRVARKAGNVMREIQNTSQSFIREMERAADLQDEAAKPPYEPPPYEPVPYDAAAYNGVAHDESAYEAGPGDDKPFEPRPYHETPAGATRTIEPPAPDPERPPDAVSEKLAEPRPALGWDTAEPAPQGDHAPHL